MQKKNFVLKNVINPLLPLLSVIGLKTFSVYPLYIIHPAEEYLSLGFNVKKWIPKIISSKGSSSWNFFFQI